MRKTARKKTSGNGKGLRLAIYFAALVILIVIFSGFLRVFGVARQSSFGDRRFNIEIDSQNSSQVLSLSKSENQVSIVDFNNPGQVKGLEVPIDSKIKTEEGLSKDGLKRHMIALVFKDNSLTFFDKFGILSFIFGVNDNNISQSEGEGLTEPQLTDLFSDKTISDEKETIQIVNASGVPGLGNRLAKQISIVGGNVVLVTTGEKVVDKSAINYKDSSETSKWLAKYLDIQLSKAEVVGIANVIIVLGEDESDSPKF